MQIKATLGGEVRAIVSGGAPLAPHVEEFLKVVMCAPVVQGYGLTETCAASFIACPDDIKHAGTVGVPQPVTTFCLESVPEMKYDANATPPRGELLVKGPNNFQGYFKMDDKTVRSCTVFVVIFCCNCRHCFTPLSSLVSSLSSLYCACVLVVQSARFVQWHCSSIQRCTDAHEQHAEVQMKGVHHVAIRLHDS